MNEEKGVYFVPSGGFSFMYSTLAGEPLFDLFILYVDMPSGPVIATKASYDKKLVYQQFYSIILWSLQRNNLSTLSKPSSNIKKHITSTVQLN